MRRRSFFGTFGAAALPASSPAFQPSSGDGSLKIDALEFWRLEGVRRGPVGAFNQYQVQQLHIYDELRPDRPRGRENAPEGDIKTSALYLKVRTNQGLDGLYGPIDEEAAMVADQMLRRFVTGKDALAGEKLWDEMYRSNRHARRGLFMMATSAIDNAVWDLRGRYYKTPVYRLLGGPTRPAIQAYGSALGYSIEPEEARKKAVELKQKGFIQQKWFLAYGPGSGLEGLQKNIALVRELRAGVGDEVDLMFDAYSGWDLEYAVKWCKAVEKYNPRWIEEPFNSDQLESFNALSRSTSIPVATGEHFAGRWEAFEFLKAGAITVCQADPEWCGGTSELNKICALASVYGAHVIPHGHSIHAALHIVASQSPFTCPLVEYLIQKMESYYYFDKQPPAPLNGKFELSDRPGFGMEWDEAKVRNKTLVKWS